MRLRRSIGITLVGTIAAATLVGAQSKPSSAVLRPEDRAAIEQAGGALVQALNSGKSADWLSLHAATTLNTVGAERLTNQFNRIRETVGALEFHHAEVAEFPIGTERSRVLHVFAKSTRENRWKDFQVAIEPTSPFKFDHVAFIADVAEPVFLPNGDLPDPNTKKWLESYIDQLVAQEDLSGSVLVTKGDTVILARTFGHADAAKTRPISAHTRFSMASASKMFTAVLVAKLVEGGKLSYTDTHRAVLPGAGDARRVGTGDHRPTALTRIRRR
jgi:hypothetical protein